MATSSGSYTVMQSSGKISFLDIHNVFGGPAVATTNVGVKAYTSPGVYSYVVPSSAATVQVLVIGGGGGGAAGTAQETNYSGVGGGGGGGGGGGQVSSNATFAVTGGTNLSVTVGAAGAGGFVGGSSPTAGGATSITGGAGGASISAAGGSAAGSNGTGGASGSGNAGGSVIQITTATAALSIHGGSGGGGNSAGGSSSSSTGGGAGGSGSNGSISGCTIPAAAGGGGGAPYLSWASSTAGAGGSPGGGAGGLAGSCGRDSTSVGSGGGGGGAGYTTYTYSPAVTTSTFYGYVSSSTLYVTTATPGPVAVGLTISAGQSAPVTPTTAYVLVIGEENIANYGPSIDTYSPAGSVQRMTINGGWEVAGSPGTTDRLATGYNYNTGAQVVAPYGISGGNMDGRLGDALIATGLYNAVKIVNVSVRGASIAMWSSTATSSTYNSGTPLGEDNFAYQNNKLYERIQFAVTSATMQSFAFTHVIYQGGETDSTSPNWTSYNSYLTRFAQFRNDLRNLGITAPIIISKTSQSIYAGGVTTNSTVTNAQQTIADTYADVWPGPVTDFYGGSYRWDSPPYHFNGAGFTAIALDWANAATQSYVGYTATYFVSGSASVKPFNTLTTTVITANVSGSGNGSTWRLDKSFYVGSVNSAAIFNGTLTTYVTTTNVIVPGGGGAGTEGAAYLYSPAVSGSCYSPFYCYYRGGTYVPNIPANNNIPPISCRPPAGNKTRIKISDFYGSSNSFCYTYTLNAGDYDIDFNLLNRAIAAGFLNNAAYLKAHVNINGVLGASRSYNNPAYNCGSGYATAPSVELTVGATGVISGFGGSFNGSGNPHPGGDAVQLLNPVKLTNNGIIQGGGGAGSSLRETQQGNFWYGAGGGAGYLVGVGGGGNGGRGEHPDGTLFSGGTPQLSSIGVPYGWSCSYTGIYITLGYNNYYTWGGAGGGWVANSYSPSIDGYGKSAYAYGSPNARGGEPYPGECSPGGYGPGHSVVNYYTYASARYTGTGIFRGSKT